MKQIIFAVALLAALPAGAQTQTDSPWKPINANGGTVAVSVTSSSAATALAAGTASPAPRTYVCNTGAVTAYVVFGNASAVATTTNGFPAQANNCYLFDTTGSGYIAAITASSTTTLVAAGGTGNPAVQGSAGTGALGVTLPLTVANGGTGDSTLTVHGVLVGNTASAINATAAGTLGVPLIGQGAADPVFGTAIVAGGGTGATTLTNHGVLLGQGTAAIVPTAAGTTGIPLIGQGAAADPVFGTAVVGGGGTGATTLTAHGVLLGEGTSAVTPTAVGTTGQLLQGSTGADPGWATTLSGAYTFSNALVTFGNAAGTPTHIATAQTTAPALTSCGTGSPTITGTDEAGIVTMGTSATGCVITFNVAYTGTPFCVVTWIATPLASQSYVTSNAAITTTQTSASGNKLQYICRAPAGG